MKKKDIIIVVLAVVVVVLLMPGILGSLFKISWAIFKFIAVAIAIIIIINFAMKKMKK